MKFLRADEELLHVCINRPTDGWSNSVATPPGYEVASNDIFKTNLTFLVGYSSMYPFTIRIHCFRLRGLIQYLNFFQCGFFDLHSKASSISKQKFFSLHLEKVSDVFLQLALFVIQSLVL